MDKKLDILIVSLLGLLLALNAYTIYGSVKTYGKAVDIVKLAVTARDKFDPSIEWRDEISKQLGRIEAKCE